MTTPPATDVHNPTLPGHHRRSEAIPGRATPANRSVVRSWPDTDPPSRRLRTAREPTLARPRSVTA